MLRFMRENAGSWIIKILLGAVVIVFIFLYISPKEMKNENVAAVVNNKIITMDEYKMAYSQILQRYKSQFGDNLNNDLLKMLRIDENTLEGIIDREILLQTARKLGIRVTDDELREFISQKFQENGSFSPSLYTNYIRNTYQRADLFESDQRNDMVIRKLQALMDSTEPVSEDLVRQWFSREKSEVDIAYVLFDPENEAGTKPSEDEIKAYYDKHKDEFKSEPSTKVKCIQFRPDDFAGKVTLTDEDVEKFYASNISKYETPKTVEARHILIKVDRNADQAQVEKARSKAKEIYQLAVGEGKDFAELAKTYSEDSTKDKGGYLGAFEKESMVKPFSDKAFSMKAGEISEPVRTEYGWHLIKVEKVNDAKQRQLSEVKDEIRKNLVKEKAENLAYEASNTAYDNIVGGSDLEQAAKSANLSVITTDFFTQADGPMEIDPSASKDFARLVFGMEPKQTSEILEFKGIYIIAQMVEKKKAELLPLDDVRESVYADLLKEIKNDQARKSAENLIVSIKEGRADMDTVRNVKESGFFTRDGQNVSKDLEPSVISAAFELKPANNICEAPIKGDNGFYVIKLKEKKEPDSELYEKEKNRIKNEISGRKRSQAFSHWLEQLKSQSNIERVLKFRE